ncbi:MAG: hypothetical protein ABJN65_06860 [Parasphingorhabdus sp.]
MLERVCWVVLALIHLSPFAAFFAPTMITRLYSVETGDPSFAILHHRAALFGLIVIACLWAVFDPNVRKLAVVLTSLSMFSFLLIYMAYGQPLPLKAIAIVDILGLPFLALVAWKAFSV